MRTLSLIPRDLERLTSLAAVVRGAPVTVRGRKRPIELLFNLEHPEELAFVTEVNEDGPDGEDFEERIEDEADSTEDDLQKRFGSASGRRAWASSRIRSAQPLI